MDVIDVFSSFMDFSIENIDNGIAFAAIFSTMR